MSVRGFGPPFMSRRASSTPKHSPAVNGRPPYMNTIGFPRFFVSSNGTESSFANALHENQLAVSDWVTSEEVDIGSHGTCI